jgi:hypothetical protein
MGTNATEKTSSIHMLTDFRFLRHFPLGGADHPKSSGFNFYNTNSMWTGANEVQASLRAMSIAASNREYENLYHGVFKTNLKSADEATAGDVAH